MAGTRADAERCQLIKKRDFLSLRAELGYVTYS